MKKKTGPKPIVHGNILGVEFPEEMLERLRAEAKANGLHMSTLIRLAVRNLFKMIDSMPEDKRWSGTTS
jgi:hypothetical protein